MKKSLVCRTCAAVLVLSLTASAFAERGPVYISPNNDGIQDTLEVPLKIKEKRYISEWNFIITNESGEVVRTIGNKVALPDRITFKTFFRSLVTPKQGVPVPSSIIWNGFFDDGSLAPDGIYYYQFTASDDNGNTATTSKMQVIVDNTPPEINLARLTDSDKSFGEGAKATLKIKQSGSTENLWTAKITDVDGKLIQNYKWENASPVDVEWNGTDSEGSIVSDGVYNYEITATDLAGNTSEKAVISNIIYSAEKPETSIAIAGSKYFSPNGDGVLDTMNFNVSIPEPTSKVNALTSWAVDILSKNSDKIMRNFSGKNNPPKSISFDGKAENGEVLPEGEYTARVTARYLNGFEPEPLYSPVFVLDVTAPKAVVNAGSEVFNGIKAMEINQQQLAMEEAWTGEKTWTGKILNEKGGLVREFDFGTSLPESIKWNGVDASGRIAPDGNYVYELSVTELAGNSSSVRTKTFELYTKETELVLAVSPQAFSPNGDGIQDKVDFTMVANDESGIERYTLSVLDAKKNVVRKISGTNSLPQTLSWDGFTEDGTRCSDGSYFAKLETVAKSGTSASTETSAFVLDNTEPEVAVSVPYSIFSPDGVSSKQKIPVSVTKSSVEDKWSAEIIGSNGKTVRSYSWQKSRVQDFAWDGTDDNGNKAANGKYSIKVSSTDAAGNKGEALIKDITLDARETKAYITNALDVFSPKAPEGKNAQKFTVKTSLAEGISAWKFSIVDATNNASVREWSEKDSKDLPANFTWAGDKTDGTVANGVYVGKLHVEYAKGNSVDATSSMFVCAQSEPKLSAKTAPKYFSPDNDGNDDDLFIKLSCETMAGIKNWSFTIKDRNGQSFWKTSGKSSMTERIIWDGRGNNGELVQSAEDYPYEFIVTDELGLTSTFTGVIQTDVLVVRDGDKLKMQVPSIIFRSDNADFGVKGAKDANGRVISQGITDAQKANNERILDMIATALKKFSDYRVTVVGHANKLTDNPDEETVDNMSLWGPALGPLSQARAQYVKEQLVKRGVPASRLSVEGKGGTEPVADTKNKAVNWKNRRVEFILEK